MNSHPDFAAHARVAELLLPCGCQAYRHDGSRSEYHQALCLLRLAEGRASDADAAAWLRERNEWWVREHPWRTNPP